MRQCSSCSLSKDDDSFGMNGSFRRRVCKLCLKQKDNRRNTINVRMNRDRARNVEHGLMAYIMSAKTDKPCSKCGDIYEPRMMQFDHIDRGSKVANLSSMKSCHSKHMIDLELAKCELLCIYCHRKKTAIDLQSLSDEMSINDKVEDAGLDSIRCRRCSISQHSDEFIWCKGSLIRVCKNCERVRSRNRRLEAFSYVNKIKGTNPCVDCNKFMDPCCMDFDHLPGEVKLNNISSMCSQGVSVCKSSEEIRKCDLVCAGCHITRTLSRGQHLTVPIKKVDVT